MAVTLVWSSTNGSTAIVSPLDHGDSSNGANTTPQEIFLRHDGTNSITSVSLYARAYSAAYSGAATALADFNKLVTWGNASTAVTFGGLQLNFLATTSYPTSAWPTVSSKTPVGGNTIRGGVGDSSTTALTIPTTTGAVSAGVIQSGMSPNVRFKMRIQVPASEDTVGIRQYDTVISYTYTSQENKWVTGVNTSSMAMS